MKRNYLFEWTERYYDGEGGSERTHHKIIKSLNDDEFNSFCKEEQSKFSTIDFKVTVLDNIKDEYKERFELLIAFSRFIETDGSHLKSHTAKAQEFLKPYLC